MSFLNSLLIHYSVAVKYRNIFIVKNEFPEIIPKVQSYLLFYTLLEYVLGTEYLFN